MFAMYILGLAGVPDLDLKMKVVVFETSGRLAGNIHNLLLTVAAGVTCGHKLWLYYISWEDQKNGKSQFNRWHLIISNLARNPTRSKVYKKKCR